MENSWKSWKMDIVFNIMGVMCGKGGGDKYMLIIYLFIVYVIFKI